MPSTPFSISNLPKRSLTTRFSFSPSPTSFALSSPAGLFHSINSGASGTLDDALYYSFLAVEKGNEGEYASADGGYSIDNIRGKGAVTIGGLTWSARSQNGAAIPAGALVKVLRIEGVKVFVEPVRENTRV